MHPPGKDRHLRAAAALSVPPASAARAAHSVATQGPCAAIQSGRCTGCCILIGKVQECSGGCYASNRDINPGHRLAAIAPVSTGNGQRMTAPTCGVPVHQSHQRQVGEGCGQAAEEGSAGAQGFVPTRLSIG